MNTEGCGALAVGGGEGEEVDMVWFGLESRDDSSILGDFTGEIIRIPLIVDSNTDHYIECIVTMNHFEEYLI